MIKHIIFILFFIITLGFLVRPALADDDLSRQGIGCGGGLGPIGEKLCELTNPGNTDDDAKKELVGNTVNTLVSGIINFITAIAGLWFMIQFVLSGVQWISAGGDKGMLETARNRMLHSIVGLVIVVSAWMIVGLVGKLVGLSILNPGAVVTEIKL